MRTATVHAFAGTAIAASVIFACATTTAAPVPSGVEAGACSDASVDQPSPKSNAHVEAEAGEYPCPHAPVVQKCADWWCEIPAGCFWMGSPETEYGRGQTTEPLVPTTLTHSFVMQQYETTRAAWKAVGFRDPTGDAPANTFVACRADNCSVGSINYFEGLAYANAMSERDGYASCYELVGCTGVPGNGMTCDTFRVKDAISYDCEGYRFPMGAEWEYAARAGTRTAFYSGDVVAPPQPADCDSDPGLDEIAWYCHNAAASTHPVGLKKPNGWGLYDMLGNSMEFVIDHQRYSGYGTGPQRDPGDPVFINKERASRGSLVVGWPSVLRAASWVGNVGWTDRSDGLTVRLVRTLHPRTADAGAADAAGD